MNSTLHIIKRDLAHFRWGFAAWAACLGLLLVQAAGAAPAPGNARDFIQLFCFLLGGIVAVGVIAGMMQQERPAQLASGAAEVRRLLAAKLGLIIGAFVAVPLLAFVLKNALSSRPSLFYAAEYGLVFLVLTSLALSFAAMATCTGNRPKALLLWLGVAAGAMLLMSGADRWLTATTKGVGVHLTLYRVLSVLGIVTVAALAIVVNQYFRRRAAVTYALIAGGAIALALSGCAWSWYYFYSTQ